MRLRYENLQKLTLKTMDDIGPEHALPLAILTLAEAVMETDMNGAAEQVAEGLSHIADGVQVKRV